MHAIFQALEVRSRSQAAIVASRLNKVLNEQIQAALKGETKIAHLLASMHKRRFKRNELLFRKGDPSREIYYVLSGNNTLAEEIGAELAGRDCWRNWFVQSQQETHVQRALRNRLRGVCDSRGKGVEDYCQDSEFAVYVTHLIAERLLADKARMANLMW